MRNIFVIITGIIATLSQLVSAQWVQTSKLNSSILALAVNGSNIFAGTDGSGIFRSTSNGTNWTAVNNGLTDSIVQCFAVSSNNIFAGTLGGVFLSNNGTSWTAVNNGLMNTSVRSLAVSGNNIFAGTDGSGIFLTTNNGTNWTAVNAGLTNSNVQCFAVSSNNIFAGTDGSGIFCSINNGTSWTAVNNGLTDSNVTSLAVSGNNILAGTYYINAALEESGNIYLSTNNGASWTAVKNIPIAKFAVSGSSIFASSYLGDHWAPTSGVYLSTNNGTSWVAFNSGLSVYDVWYIRSFAVTDTYIFAGTTLDLSSDSSTIYRRPLSDTLIVNTQKSITSTEKFNISVNNMMLKYTLLETSNVTVRIFDLKGRLVFSSVIPGQSTGLHSLSLQQRNLSLGNYVLDFSAGVYKICKTIMMKRD